MGMQFLQALKGPHVSDTFFVHPFLQRPTEQAALPICLPPFSLHGTAAGFSSFTSPRRGPPVRRWLELPRGRRRFWMVTGQLNR
ncbi:hypothetical protein Taro_019984 [Colocasia esculenta]|uniref:Uncharacterized protein n=1 Tax=Colocasia esculenta TaxID=4460 RepID=A0A843UMG9_COLES|nr:hypothetical protein [Colocasia esculenta]